MNSVGINGWSLTLDLEQGCLHLTDENATHAPIRFKFGVNNAHKGTRLIDSPVQDLRDCSDRRLLRQERVYLDISELILEYNDLVVLWKLFQE